MSVIMSCAALCFDGKRVMLFVTSKAVYYTGYARLALPNESLNEGLVI